MTIVELYVLVLMFLSILQVETSLPLLLLPLTRFSNFITNTKLEVHNVMFTNQLLLIGNIVDITTSLNMFITILTQLHSPNCSYGTLIGVPCNY